MNDGAAVHGKAVDVLNRIVEFDITSAVTKNVNVVVLAVNAVVKDNPAAVDRFQRQLTFNRIFRRYRNIIRRCRLLIHAAGLFQANDTVDINGVGLAAGGVAGKTAFTVVGNDPDVAAVNGAAFARSFVVDKAGVDDRQFGHHTGNGNLRIAIII